MLVQMKRNSKDGSLKKVMFKVTIEVVMKEPVSLTCEKQYCHISQLCFC